MFARAAFRQGRALSLGADGLGLRAGMAGLAMRRSNGSGLRSAFTTPIGVRMIGSSPEFKRRLSSAMIQAHEFRPPTLEDAKAMPTHYSQLGNEVLFMLAESGDHSACKERLTRHIMAVDEIDWMQAREKVKEINKKDSENLFLVVLPYTVGIVGGAGAAVACIPMVFNKQTALWMNEHFVTGDVPEAEDLETMLEVGSWSWNWMEPPLGVASFVILTMQLVRSQMLNMDWKPYTSWARAHRAKRLAKAYPRYNLDFVKDFSKTHTLNMFNR